MDDSATGAANPDARWIGPYRLLESIGTGGMGEVFLAEGRDPVPCRVALKIMRSDRIDRRMRARFELEQQALARMDHPNIARIFDSGVTEAGQAWFAMEHVPGLPLTDYCDEHRLSVPARLELFRQICDGVQHAHMRGLLHRDLKPSNILVREIDDRPVAKIIDFGLARPLDPLQLRATLHEELQRIIGTVAYMSPEQAGLTPEDVDTRTDVYSLGVVLYELLVGTLPFPIEDLVRLGPMRWPSYLRETEPKRPSTRLSDLGAELQAVAERRGLLPKRLRALIGGELEWVTMKALERDRHRRYDSARQLGQDVERFLTQRPVLAGPPGLYYRLRKWTQRHTAGVAITGIVLGAGAITAAASFLLAQRAAAAETERRMIEQGFVVAELLRQADEELWPVGFALPERCLEWQQRVAAQQATRAEIELRAGALANAATLTAAAGDGATATVLRDRAERLQQTVAALNQLDARQRWVAHRVDRSRSLAQRSLQAHAASWDQAIAAIATSPIYQGFSMPRLPGLVPLGPNAQGCHEFLLLESDADSVPPIRRDDGGFDITAGCGMVFVLVPGGNVTTGASQAADAVHHDPLARPYEAECPHSLAPFLLSRYEMTQDQWARMMCEAGDDADLLDEHQPSNKPEGLQAVRHGPPHRFAARAARDDPNWIHPVQQLDWRRAVRHLRRLGLELPSCVQWEHACRGGTDGPWSFPREQAPQHANLYGVEGRGLEATDPVDGFVWTSPVGASLPNGYGLHDMLGNVSEFCSDYPNSLLRKLPLCDSRDPLQVQRAAHRGGSYVTSLELARCAAFQQIPIVNIDPTVGVRPILPWPGDRR